MTRAARPLGLVALVVVLAFVVFFSITQGSRQITLDVIWAALRGGGEGTDVTVVRDMRVPRTIIGLTAGIALGLGGAVLQAATRNPLADPGIMGINAGAAAVIVTAVVALGVTALPVLIGFGFVGACLAVAVVFSIASRGREGATPTKLALAGAAVTAGLTSYTSAIVLTRVDALDELRFWQVGSLAGRYAEVMWPTLPVLVLGSIAALFTGRALNSLAMGDDVAAGLGVDVRRTRGLLFVLVALLCGAAVAACGPIVFLGLAVPHVARMLVGTDYGWVLAYTALLAPIIFLLADVVGRLVVSPGELQVGVVMGVIGAPAFIALVRYRTVAEL